MNESLEIGTRPNTPDEVVNAMQFIGRYLAANGYKECVVAPSGGGSLLRTTTAERYHQILETLQDQVSGLQTALEAVSGGPRLLTVHICATETGVSVSYPENANAADVAAFVWEYVRNANTRGERITGAIRGPYREKYQEKHQESGKESGKESAL